MILVKWCADWYSSPAPRLLCELPALTDFLPIKNTSGSWIPQAEYPLCDLALLPFLTGLSMNDLSLLLQSAWVQYFSDGHILFRNTDQATHFFAILDGHVELFIEDNAGKNVLEIAQPPTLLGESALSGNATYLESARIIGHSRLLVIPADSFAAILSQRMDLALRLLSSMSIRLHGLITQISSLKLKSTAQRLGSFLLGIADTQNSTVTARFPYDKRLVAEQLGMSAETLSRALTRLAPLGVKSQGDASMVILEDIGALCAFCGEDSTE